MNLAQEGAQCHQRGEDTVAGLNQFLLDHVNNVFDRQYYIAPLSLDTKSSDT
jgi:hypothetical protein